MHRYKELKVWQKAIELTVEVYKITKNLPREEKFALANQLNRCAVSIPSNIAEGAGRNSNKDFNNFLGIALGSAFELETQLLIINHLGYLSDDDYVPIRIEIEHIQNMLIKLKDSLNQI
jgi:four helix bundle protein